MHPYMDIKVANIMSADALTPEGTRSSTATLLTVSYLEFFTTIHQQNIVMQIFSNTL